MPSSLSKDEKCLFCGKTEADAEDTHWVQCQECQKWAHFSCAGVDQEVVKTTWNCPQCAPKVQQLKVPKPAAKKNAKKTGSKSDAGSEQSSVTDLTEKQSEEEQLLKETFAKRMEARKMQLARQKALYEQQMKQEWEMREQELQFQREIEKQQLDHEQKILAHQLAAEREFVKKRNAIRKQIDSSIRRVNALKEQDNAAGGAVGGDPEKKSEQRVKQWLQEQEIGRRLKIVVVLCS